MKSPLTIQIIGTISILAGLFINYYISRSKFNRRNHSGIEIFRSYEKAKLTALLEKMGRIIAFILLVFGLFIIILSLV